MLKKDAQSSSDEEGDILDVVCPADLSYDFQEYSTEDELDEAMISEEASEMLTQLHTLGPLGFISLQRTLAHHTPSNVLSTFGLSMPEGMEHVFEHAKWEYVKQVLIRYVYIRPRNVKVCSAVCDVVHLLRTCRNIMIVSGAGVHASFTFRFRWRAESLIFGPRAGCTNRLGSDLIFLSPNACLKLPILDATHSRSLLLPR